MEISKDLPLSSEEQKMIDMHSFYNALSVVTSLCYLIEFDLENEGALKENTKIIHDLKEDLSNRYKLLKHLKNYSKIKTAFFDTFEKTLHKYPAAQTNKDIIEEKDNMYSIFKVIDSRVAEMNKRLNNDGGWKTFNLKEIEADLIQFFSAIEKNAKGKYRIVYDAAKQLPNDYLVLFSMNSINNKTIFIHDKMIDTMRDLLANSRKYTPYGGKIEADLNETESDISFIIKDNGLGIPKDEVEHVVEFGYRASNTKRKKTMGGGFGLTKAYFFVKHNRGRFWIDSDLNQGTEIKIVIPKP